MKIIKFNYNLYEPNIKEVLILTTEIQCRSLKKVEVSEGVFVDFPFAET